MRGAILANAPSLNELHGTGCVAHLIPRSQLQDLAPKETDLRHPDKIRILRHRFGASQFQKNKHALEHGISIDRGGVWLTLNDEQYQELKR
jgi:hypothetical protein